MILIYILDYQQLDMILTFILDNQLENAKIAKSVLPEFHLNETWILANLVYFTAVISHTRPPTIFNGERSFKNHYCHGYI